MLKKLEKGEIAPVYLFCGSERCLMEEALKKVESAVVEPATRSFNYSVFQCPDATAEAIVDAARTVPMMAKRRLVVVKDIERLASSETETLGRYLKDPSPSTCLVLTAEKVDMRKGFFQALKGSTVSFEPLHENQLPSWIKKEAESFGKRISPDAARHLTEVVGNDLLRLRNELEKVSLFAGDSKEISLMDVEAVSTRSRLDSIFHLTDAIGVKDAGKAIKVVGELLYRGESGVYILYMVTRQLRLIWKVKELMDAGKEHEAIRREVNIPPFLYKGVMGQAKKFSVKNLREAFPRLLEADASLKSGRLTERLVLEGLFLELAKG